MLPRRCVEGAHTPGAAHPVSDDPISVCGDGRAFAGVDVDVHAAQPPVIVEHVDALIA